MSIQSEIDRIKAAKADAKAALIERGVDPGDATIDEYGDQIRAIPTGVTSFNGRTGAVEPQAGDYTADMIGAVPTTRTVNGKPLSGNVSLVAGDVGADPAGSAASALTDAKAYADGLTAADIGAIPTVNGSVGQLLGFTSTNVVGAVDAPSGGAGKRTCRFVVGTSTAGWTESDCDYLCDGTDDQVEINAAIQALPSGGGEIVILDGTYNITATIAMDKDNVKLSGNGNATVLRRMWDSSTGEGVITITATNGGCCVENIFIDGNNSVYSSSSNYGIYLYSSSNNNTITGNTCNNNNNGIGLSSSSNNTITGNTCNNNNNSGIYLYSSSNNNTITGNTCNNNNNYGIYLPSSNNNTITGNTCNNNYNGIELYSSSNNNTITGNTCNNNYNGIELYSSNNNTITGNTCNNNYNGIELSSSSNNNTITGNTCNNNNNGIELSSSSNNNTITGNTCNNNNNSGIYLYSSNNNTITGNTCNNNYNGIELYSSSNNNTITGNTCIRGEGTSSDYTSSQYTIRLNGATNNYNLISSNNIMGKNYTSGGGTGNTFVNNKYN